MATKKSAAAPRELAEEISELVDVIDDISFSKTYPKGTIALFPNGGFYEAERDTSPITDDMFYREAGWRLILERMVRVVDKPI